MFQQIVKLVYLMLSVTSVMSTTLRVMPMGDSITVGRGFEGGYRKSLFYFMRENDYDVQFLGSSTANNSSRIATVDRHEGHESWGINDFLEYSREMIEDVDDPDVIFLMVGLEDMIHDDLYRDAVDRLGSLISLISNLRPYSHLLVSNLLPVTWNDTINDRIDLYFNVLIPKLIRKHQKRGRKVSLVDMAKKLDRRNLQTLKHPTRKGYRIMGKTWAKSIMQALGRDGDSLIPQILRAECSMDRTKVILTFTKSITEDLVDGKNFSLNNGMEILNITNHPTNRQVTLYPDRKCDHDVSYKVTLHDGVLRTTSMDSFHAGWRFIVLSDWHSAEKYVFGSQNPFAAKDIVQDIKVIRYLSKNYGGEFVMIAGDTNSGPWTRPDFKKRFQSALGKQMTDAEIVLEAGRRCYGGMLHSFRIGGYAKVLLAQGDHEAGDNPWKVGDSKSILQPEFRKTLGDQLNVDYNGENRYDGMIGGVRARPYNSTFSDTAFAYIHKNAMIVTVDPFYQESPYIDIAPSGTVAMRIAGEQLKWLDAVLAEARKMPQVKHIFVQAHIPVLHPVRRTRSSGQMLEQEQRSEFWQTLRKHKVDIYFTGEVHLNTVTKDTESNIVQIASRGNYFNNFLTVDVSDDVIDIRCLNEVGNNRIKYNFNYTESGRLVISKDGNNTLIEGSGQLALLNRSAAILHFDFEEKLPLEDRPILGLGLAPGSSTYIPTMKSVSVLGIECSEVIPNKGEFGLEYDAISANVNIVKSAQGHAGRFQETSRAALWSMGPHFEGREVSYSLWFKTRATNIPVLISYEGYWIKKTVMNFRLRNGRPEVILSADQRLRASEYHATRLNDGKWHHVVVTIPADDSLLSELKMYIDGEDIPTKVDGDDALVTFANGGVIALGGFGYGRTSSGDVTIRDSRDGFLNGDNFVGLMDEVKIFARSLSSEEVTSLYTNHSLYISRN